MIVDECDNCRDGFHKRCLASSEFDCTCDICNDDTDGSESSDGSHE